MALGMRNLARLSAALSNGSLWACVLFRGLGRAALPGSIRMLLLSPTAGILQTLGVLRR